MIPYIHVPDLTIGGGPVYVAGLKVLPITLHPFGLLVATGVLVGSALATRRARAKGYDLDKLNSFATWILVSAFVLSHMIDEVFYHPSEIVRRPWSLLMIWEGLSSFGGFIGALVGGLAWRFLAWREGRFGLGWFAVRPKPIPILPFADVLISVFPIGWALGRTGCSVVHDHPGARTTADTLLAVAYPFPGEDAPKKAFGPIELVWGSWHRFDLGLLELMFTIIIAIVVTLTWRKRLAIGTYIVVIALAYAPVRFVMDFFRIRESDGQGADLRYGSLTFAQWCCIALGLYALALWAWIRSLERRGIDLAAPVRAQAPEPAPPEPAGTAAV